MSSLEFLTGMAHTICFTDWLLKHYYNYFNLHFFFTLCYYCATIGSLLSMILHLLYTDKIWCCRWSPSTAGGQGTLLSSGCTDSPCSEGAHRGPSSRSPPWWSCSVWSSSVGLGSHCCTHNCDLGNSSPHRTRSETKRQSTGKLHLQNVPQHLSYLSVSCHLIQLVLYFCS